MLFRSYRRHPRWAYRDPVTHALEPVYSVHYNDYAARLQGAQCAYDVGVQRTCWQVHSLTNWMGDDGFLRQASCKIRRHNPEGDLLFIQGEVTKKFEENGTKLVEISLTSENQDGERSAYGHAVAALPSRT